MYTCGVDSSVFMDTVFNVLAQFGEKISLISPTLLAKKDDQQDAESEIRFVQGVVYGAVAASLGFFASTAGVVSTIPIEQSAQISTTDNSSENAKPKHIAGVRGLAEYLGCGINKAQDIVNNGVLFEEKIQYKAGRKWLFNVRKLDSFLYKNPLIFEKIRRKN